MIAAARPQRRAPAKLLHIDSHGQLLHTARDSLVELLHRGDVVVANDAATLPASLHGVHERTGMTIEVRLAGRRSMAASAVQEFTAVIFGSGDYRTRTEDRPLPPPLRCGDRFLLGPLTAVIEALLDHPRFVALRFLGTPAAIWRGIASHGVPIQYAHVPAPLQLWDVWTSIGGPPVAYEPPSAGFALDWRIVQAMLAKGVIFTTLTHAAGISSTGDAELDARLPFDEPYFVPAITADEVNKARGRARRVVAIGTTVVRALEHAGASGVIRPGPGIATQRLGRHSQLRIVDAILSGTHEPGTSHYELLHAFADDEVLRRVDTAARSCGYRTHEFGDSVLIERSAICAVREIMMPVHCPATVARELRSVTARTGCKETIATA